MVTLQDFEYQNFQIEIFDKDHERDKMANTPTQPFIDLYSPLHLSPFVYGFLEKKNTFKELFIPFMIIRILGETLDSVNNFGKYLLNNHQENVKLMETAEYLPIGSFDVFLFPSNSMYVDPIIYDRDNSFQYPFHKIHKIYDIYGNDAFSEIPQYTEHFRCARININNDLTKDLDSAKELYGNLLPTSKRNEIILKHSGIGNLRSFLKDSRYIEFLDSRQLYPPPTFYLQDVKRSVFFWTLISDLSKNDKKERIQLLRKKRFRLAPGELDLVKNRIFQQGFDCHKKYEELIELDPEDFKPTFPTHLKKWVRAQDLLKDLPTVPQELIKCSENLFNDLVTKGLVYSVHNLGLNVLKGESLENLVSTQRLDPEVYNGLLEQEKRFKQQCSLKNPAYVFRGMRLSTLEQINYNPGTITFVTWNLEKALNYFKSPASRYNETDIPILLAIKLPPGTPIIRTRYNDELILPMRASFNPTKEPQFFVPFCGEYVNLKAVVVYCTLVENS